MAATFAIFALGLLHGPASSAKLGARPSTRRTVVERAVALGGLAPAARLSALLPAAALASAYLAEPASAATAELKKVVVLGGSGFVGSRVCKQLVAHGAGVVSISRSGRPALAGTWADKVEWVSADVSDEVLVAAQMKGADAVISTLGVIFGNGAEADRANNAKPNIAAADAAAGANVPRFVYVSVSSQVGPVVSPLLGDGYFKGKADAEAEILGKFTADRSLLIKPTFIFGGDDFSLSPPRVSGAYGGIIDSLLSSAPIRAIAGIAPGFIKLALLPPVSVDEVAAAAVAGALGLKSGSVDGHDEIVAAAALVSA
mmetsp:Transcript_22784/g.56844  ORF Transcript_22784/g.56844 Transcript_22784/m.56844 type:complete len:315 (+) Transcript_22784:25-969(+)